jgi:hypothetical protein
MFSLGGPTKWRISPAPSHLVSGAVAPAARADPGKLHVLAKWSAPIRLRLINPRRNPRMVVEVPAVASSIPRIALAVSPAHQSTRSARLRARSPHDQARRRV